MPRIRAFDTEKSSSWHYRFRVDVDTKLDLLRLASRGRLKSFLAIKPGDGGVRWESDQRQSGATGSEMLALFTGKWVCQFARDILAQLIEAPEPLPLREILDRLEFYLSKQKTLVAKALGGLCHYLFTAAAYDSARADLVLGLWPGLRKRLDGTATSPPRRPPPPRPRTPPSSPRFSDRTSPRPWSTPPPRRSA